MIKPIAELIQPFIDAGVVPPDCCRIVIDIPANGVLRVYYEILGDQRVLDVMTGMIQRGELPTIKQESGI